MKYRKTQRRSQNHRYSLGVGKTVTGTRVLVTGLPVQRGHDFYSGSVKEQENLIGACILPDIMVTSILKSVKRGEVSPISLGSSHSGADQFVVVKTDSERSHERRDWLIQGMDHCNNLKRSRGGL